MATRYNLSTDTEPAPGQSGDPSALHSDVAAEISGITEKVSPVGADVLVIEDSADSNNKKRVQVNNLPGGPSPDPVFHLSLHSIKE